MQTYVYSLHGCARLTHVGNMHGTACGYIFTSSFHVSENAPPARPICERCIARCDANTVVMSVARILRMADRGIVVRQRAIDVHAAMLAARHAERDAAIVSLLKEGADNAGVARRLRMGLRTTVRHVNDALRRSGARTRFQWGYKVGLAEGRAES
jgi:DNA-binding CsgD family transcriptional regulator